jgi:hypothetical protein
MDWALTTAAATIDEDSNTLCDGGWSSKAITATTWETPTDLRLTTANFGTTNCGRVTVSTAATDLAGNTMASNFTLYFIIQSSTATVTVTSNVPYYPGTSVALTGTGWGGTGAVTATWPDGTVMTSSLTVDEGADTLSGTATLPAHASVGLQSFKLSQASGPTAYATVTVKPVTHVQLSASPTDVNPGGSTVVTALVLDAGTPLVGVPVRFSEVTDPSARGDFDPDTGVNLSSTVATTNGSGIATATYYISTGSTYSDITLSAATGGLAPTILIVDPIPLPPTNLTVAATDRLTYSWTPSPSPNVAGYRLYIGTEPGQYTTEIQVGLTTTAELPNPVGGKTYYAVVRAFDGPGAFSEPSNEVAGAVQPTLVAVTSGANGRSCLSGGSSGGVGCEQLFNLPLAEPGQSAVSSVTLRNGGNAPAGSIGVFASLCTPGNSPGATIRGTGNPCEKTLVYVQQWADAARTVPVACLYGSGSTRCDFDSQKTLSTFTTAHGSRDRGLSAPAGLTPGATAYFSVGLKLDPDAGNAYQGRTAQTDFTWYLRE